MPTPRAYDSLVLILHFLRMGQKSIPRVIQQNIALFPVIL